MANTNVPQITSSKDFAALVEYLDQPARPVIGRMPEPYRDPAEQVARTTSALLRRYEHRPMPVDLFMEHSHYLTENEPASEQFDLQNYINNL